MSRASRSAPGHAFVSWADNEKIVFMRNDKYWKPSRPYLTASSSRSFRNDDRLALGDRRPERFGLSLPPRQKPIIDRVPAKDRQRADALCLPALPQLAAPPLDNVKVRQAINFAIDREAFVKATMGGLAEVAWMALPSAHWAYDKSVAELYPHDPDKAASCSPRPASRTARDHLSAIPIRIQSAPGSRSSSSARPASASNSPRADPRISRVLCRREEAPGCWRPGPDGPIRA